MEQILLEAVLRHLEYREVIHRIIESSNGLSWKAPKKSSDSKPPAMGLFRTEQRRLWGDPIAAF